LNDHGLIYNCISKTRGLGAKSKKDMDYRLISRNLRGLSAKWLAKEDFRNYFPIEKIVD
jgi:hypothetical protein